MWIYKTRHKKLFIFAFILTDHQSCKLVYGIKTCYAVDAPAYVLSK